MSTPDVELKLHEKSLPKIPKTTMSTTMYAGVLTHILFEPFFSALHFEAEFINVFKTSLRVSSIYMYIMSSMTWDMHGKHLIALV